MKNRVTKTTEDKITRKEALKKAGRYAAFTAAASVTLLTPLRADEPTSMGSGYGGGPGPVKPPGGGTSRGMKKTPWDQPKPSAPAAPGTLKKSPWS